MLYLILLAAAAIDAAVQHILFHNPQRSRLPVGLWNNSAPGTIDPFHLLQGLFHDLLFVAGMLTGPELPGWQLALIWIGWYQVRNIFHHTVYKRRREWPFRFFS